MTFYDGFLFTTVTTSVLLLFVPLVHRLAPHVITRWFPHYMGSTLKQFRNLLVKGIAIFVRSMWCDACSKSWEFRLVARTGVSVFVFGLNIDIGMCVFFLQMTIMYPAISLKVQSA